MMDDDDHGYRRQLLKHFRSFGIQGAPGAGEDGTWSRCNARLAYGRTHFDSLLRDKQEVFRFLWENRDALNIDSRGYIEVESIRPALRVAPDGFILRETVAEYVQILTLTAKELRDELAIEVPAAIEHWRRLRLYGGGTLIFDDYGQMKYHIANHLAKSRHDRRRQAERLTCLWERGQLDSREGISERLAGIHLARAQQFDRDAQAH